MRITAKLHLILLLPLLLLLIVGAVLLHSNRIINLEAQRESLVDGVTRGTFELNILTHEYLQHHLPRAKQQWRRKHVALTETLASMDFPAPRDRATLEEARWTLAQLGDLFSDLIGMENAGLTAGSPVERELRDRLVGQLLAESQSLISLTSTLSRVCDEMRSRTRRHSDWLTILFIGATVIGVGTSMILLSHGITRPIFQLRRGAEKLAGGRLDHKIGSTADDEVGELARAFDQMAESLQQRVAERDRALEELRQHRDHLEELVAERTAELQQMTSALARSNAELEQFAYVASHDLREPLRMVTSFVQLIEQKYQDKLDADGTQYIRFVVDGARRMDGLINDLLEYARVGTHAKEFTAVDCNAAVQVALKNLDVAIRENHAAITVAGLLPTVEGDDVQLTQLFQNLIANGIKFRRADEPPRIEIAAVRDRNEWVFSVRDNGIGIEPKFFERIFVIFQRLHARDEYSGTGIGLAVCKKIVERHGGRIWVESEPGQGSTFYFILPIPPSDGVKKPLGMAQTTPEGGTQ